MSPNDMVRPERVMTLLDRFRAQPPQKHADPGVRLAYVQEIPIDERDVSLDSARFDVVIMDVVMAGPDRWHRSVPDAQERFETWERRYW